MRCDRHRFGLDALLQLDRRYWPWVQQQLEQEGNLDSFCIRKWRRQSWPSTDILRPSCSFCNCHYFLLQWCQSFPPHLNKFARRSPHNTVHIHFKRNVVAMCWRWQSVDLVTNGKHHQSVVVKLTEWVKCHAMHDVALPPCI